ncbi:MAG: hypothetical protein RL210_1980 [Pseudomonadota bacterium]|jgi:hypothetical protein|nr:hypothetical protein [Pseudomonadota bacterium]
MPKAKDKTGKNNAMRENIAHIAARLIAVDGIEDFALAKRKAAHQAGCDDTQNLPTNSEVELALKSYRELYFRDAHPQLLNTLRREALQVMRQFERLSPYLVGSVLNGSAGSYSDINLHIYSDNPKEVELFLLDRHVQYRHLPARSERAHLCVNFYSNDVPVTLTVFPENDLRRSTNKGENSALERARIDQLQKLIADSSSGQTNEQLQMLTSSAG